jgi:hypothetical protein
VINCRQLDHRVRSIIEESPKEKSSSSPVSHIRHLEQAAQMALKMNHLLKQEIMILRTETKNQKEGNRAS